MVGREDNNGDNRFTPLRVRATNDRDVGDGGEVGDGVVATEGFLDLMRDQIEGFSRLLSRIDAALDAQHWAPVEHYSRWQKLTAKLSAALVIRRIVSSTREHGAAG